MGSDTESCGKYMVVFTIYLALLSVISAGIYLYSTSNFPILLIFLVVPLIFMGDVIFSNYYALIDNNNRRRKKLFLYCVIVCDIIIIVSSPVNYSSEDNIFGISFLVLIGGGVFALGGIIVGGFFSSLVIEIKNLSESDIKTDAIQYDIEIPNHIPLKEFYTFFSEHYANVLGYDSEIWTADDETAFVFREIETPNYLLLSFNDNKLSVLPYLKKGVVYHLYDSTQTKSQIRTISELDFPLKWNEKQDENRIQKLIKDYQEYNKPGKNMVLIRKEIKKIIFGVILIGSCIGIIVYRNPLVTYFTDNSATYISVIIATIIGVILGHYLSKRSKDQKE